MVLQGKSWSHMWYLYMVLFLYLATPAIKWLLSRVPRIVVYIVLIVLFLGSSIFPYINKLYEAELLPVLADDLIYVFYYLCGYLFVRECASEKEKVKIPGWVILTSIGLLVASMVTGRILNIMQLRMAYDYPFTVVLSILIFAGAMKYEQSMRNNKELTLSETAKARWMGVSDLCFAIYLIHPLYINIFYKFLHIVPWNYPLQLSFPIFWILFSALALGTAWGLRRIPVLRKYVL